MFFIDDQHKIKIQSNTLQPNRYRINIHIAINKKDKTPEKRVIDNNQPNEELTLGLIQNNSINSHQTQERTDASWNL